MVNPINVIMIGYIMSFVFLGGSELADLVGHEWRAYNVDTGEWDGELIKLKILQASDTFEGCYTSDTSVPQNELIGGFANQTYTENITCVMATMPDGTTNLWIEGTGASFSGMSYQTAQMQLTMASEISVTANPLTSSAEIVYQLFQVLTGTYIFNILMFFAIPQIYVVGITMVYILTLAIWVINTLRGNQSQQ